MKLYAQSMSDFYFLRFLKVIVLLSPFEVFQRAKEERLLLQTLKNRRHLWIGHIIRHNEFVVNILKEQYPEKRLWEDLD
jgi:hypothetical protein